ncbi:MAG: hypothetical protein H0W96_13545, partial [Solirubrobacterales bacterium]|nr:hypothetical protein [Solirubrobacterales bacterium]
TALDILKLYKDQQIVERRHRDAKQSLKVRPIFLHNDDRIHALISIVGLALLIFGLIETQTRQALNGHQLPGLLPEGRAATPTGRNILAAFPRPRPDLHTARHPHRPPHPHPTPRPRAPRHPAAVARARNLTLVKCGKRG